jgi:soluble lytic murein transglycosylase
MLLCLPRKYHSEDDDYAPIDYQYVGSVAEGTRRRQGEAIHRAPDQAAVRHRVDPNAQPDGLPPADAAAANSAPRGLEAARRMRAGDPATATRVAYPRPRDNAFARTPTYAPETAPFLPADAPHDAYAQRGGRAQARVSQGYVPAGQRAPAGANEHDTPDWLRAARQNNMPLYDERRTAPRMETPPDDSAPPPTDLLGRPIARKAQPDAHSATPMTAEAYAAAGYPPELIAQKMAEDAALRAALGVGRKRHGAQLAAPPPRQRAQVNGEASPPRAAVERYARPSQGGYADGEPPINVDGGYAPAGNPYPDRPESRRRTGIRHDGPAQDAAGGAYGGIPTRQGYAPRGNVEPDWVQRGYPADGEGLRRANPYRLEDDGGNWPDDDPDAQEKPRPRIPYLGIAAFAAALALVLLWILRMTYTAQTESVLATREAAQARTQNNYPYSYRELIEREAASNNLHPAFVAAIVLNESSFNPQAESNVGARGLMQMMPNTAQWVHGKIGDTAEYSFDRMYDPDTNVHYACWYLSYLSNLFRGDPVLVSAAFHAGQTTVQNWLNDSRYSADSTSIELDRMADGPTKAYATRVLKAYAAYRRLYYEGGVPAARIALRCGGTSAGLRGAA